MLIVIILLSITCGVVLQKIDIIKLYEYGGYSARGCVLVGSIVIYYANSKFMYTFCKSFNRKRYYTN